MRLNKKQATVLILLNIAIAALVATVFLLRGAGSATSADGSNGGDHGTTVTPHEKLRKASPGKTPQIDRETRLMGSGDETVVYTHVVNGTTFIFGNASVGDLDFDNYGGFLCRTDSSGTITGFTYFAGELTAVGIANDGFCAAATERNDKGDVSKLYSVKTDGTVTAIGETDGEAVDIKAVDGRKTAVVTQPNPGSLKLTEYTYDGTAMTAGYSTRISGGFDLEYFDCYAFGSDYVIAARAHSLPRYDSLAFYKFTVGGEAPSPFYYGGKDESMITPYDVSPYDGGYMALCRRNGEAVIITVDYTFTSTRRDVLGFDFETARLIYSGGKYYAGFDRGDGAVTYVIDDKLNRKIVTAADGCAVESSAVHNGAVILACANKNTVKLFTVDGNRSVVFSADGARIYGVFITTDGNVMLVMSAKGGAALSEPTGGADVYRVVVKL